MGDVKSWTVTYTKHIKRKRKAYQDGVLEVYCSSNKVMLYDDSGELLDSRFLKKDEVVGSGESLAFDAYLIDIGDPQENCKPLTNLSVQERDRKPNVVNGIQRGQKARNIPTFVENRSNAGNTGVPQNSPNMAKDIIREWHALYTTQLTQKAKKYHDGILRLSNCGSQARQVTLYDESRKLLDSRFLKKDEVIVSGETLTFGTHLVDIGDPEGNHRPLKDLNLEGRDSKVVEKTRILHLHGQKARHSSSIGKSQNSASSGQDAGSNSSSSSVDNLELCTKGRRVCGSTPLRDAKQILSILKKPMAQDSVAATIKIPVEQSHSSQFSNLVHFDLQYQLLSESKQEAKAAQDDLVLDITDLMDSNHRGKSTSFSVSPGAAASNASTSKSDMGYTDKSMSNPAFSITGPQVSDAIILDLAEDTRPSEFNCSGSGVSKDVNVENFNQLSMDNIRTGSQGCKEASTLGLSCLSGPASRSPTDGEGESSEELKSLPKKSAETDEFPSFDLGF